LFYHFLFYYGEKITLKGSSLYSILLGLPFDDNRDIDLVVPFSLENMSQHLEEDSMSLLQAMFDKNLPPEELTKILEQVFNFDLTNAKITRYLETKESGPHYIRNINLTVNIDGKKIDIVILNQDPISKNKKKNYWEDWIFKLITQ